MHRMDGVKLISVSEAAREKGVSREAVYQAIRRGQLKVRWVLGKIGVVRSSLDAYEPRREKIVAGQKRAQNACTAAKVMVAAAGSEARLGD